MKPKHSHPHHRRLHRVYHKAKIRYDTIKEKTRLWHFLGVAAVVLILYVSVSSPVSSSKRAACQEQAMEYAKQKIITGIEDGTITADGGPAQSSHYEQAYTACLEQKNLK